jgi:DNA-directed RNA polymerase II subunit RPB2
METSSSVEPANTTISTRDIDKKVWSLIDTYFKDNPTYLVKHHLDSYNYFYEHTIREILRQNNPVTIFKEQDEESGEYINEAKLYLGGKYGSKIRYGKPIIYDETRQHYMYPNEARLRNLTYGMSIHYDVDVEINIKGKEPESHTINNVLLGRFPIMLKSKQCILSELTPDAAFRLGECRNDPGGYFIIDGKEKVIVCQEKFADNTLYIRDNVNEIYTHSAEIKCVSPDPSKPKRTVSVRIVAPKPSLSNGQIVVEVPNVRKAIPLFILMRALGIISDKEIIQTCLLDLDKHKNMVDLFIPSIHDAYQIYTQTAAIDFIKTFTKGKTKETVFDILMNYFFANVGEMNFREKAFALGYVVYRMLRVVTKQEPPTDRDSFKFKRVETSGKLIGDLFADYWKKQKQAIFLAMDTKYRYNRDTYVNNFQSLILENTEDIFADRVVEKGLRDGMKGDWGSEAYTKKQGVSQPLNRLSFFSFISHLRKLNLPMDDSAKVVKPRLLHGTQWGTICPCETPDGGSIGFHKHLAMTAEITRNVPQEDIETLIYSMSRELGTSRYTYLAYTTKVFVNGRWISNTHKPNNIVEKLITMRRNGDIDKHVNVLFDKMRNEIRVQTDEGRLTRPLYHVDDGKVNMKTQDTWQEYLKTSVEYIDTQEAEGSLVSTWVQDVSRKYTHCEIHPSLILGVMGNMITFPENNQAPRDLYSCGQSKQGVSLYHSNYQNRIDKMGIVLNYGEKPLVKSRYMKYVGAEDHPYGENAIVALACYNGYNVEDSVLINEGALKRGLFRTTYFSMVETYEEMGKYSGSCVDKKITNVINANAVGLKPGYDYSLLDENGLIKEGTPLDDKKILIGYATFGTDEVVDKSIKTKKGQLGVVDKSFITDGQEGMRIAKVRIREERIPAVGDKYSSRCGQKGTIGMIIPEEDMPFTAEGLKPDIIVNPHAIPSRMTIGQLVECLMGKALLTKGAYGDCTAYTMKGPKTKILGDILKEQGMHSSGKEYLYNGMTGEMMETDIFIGPTYYMRLKHMVKDKINYRARGPRTALTRQTVQGRANDGGLRIGEMERDGLIAHGMTSMLNDSMMNRGDEYYMAVCNQTGSLAVYNENKNLFLSPMADGPLKFTDTTSGGKEIQQISRYGRDFSIVRVPYTLKLLMQELGGLNMALRLITEDNVDYLTEITKNDNSEHKISKDEPLKDSQDKEDKPILSNYDKLKAEILSARKGVNFTSLERTNVPSLVYERLNQVGSGMDEDAVINTLNYLYNITRFGIYIAIRNGEISKFIPFVNDDYENPFPREDKWWLDTTKHSSMKKYYNEKKAYIGKVRGFTKEKITPLKKWYINGPLVGNVQGEWSDKYMKEIRKALNMTSIPSLNIDLFVNKRDGLYMKRDLTQPFQYVSQKMKLDYSSRDMAPILSFATSPDYLDIPIPTPDDINEYESFNKDEDVLSIEREPRVLFRGSATGIGVDKNSNQRLNVVTEINKLIEDGKFTKEQVDVGLTSWAVRDRIGKDGKMDFIRPATGDDSLDKNKTTDLELVSRVEMDEPETLTKYQSVIYIDGNSIAYRLLGLFLKGFCVVRVESEYGLKPWYENEFKENEHYLLIKKDMSNLEETLQYVITNPAEARDIARRGYEKAKQVLENIPTYMNNVLTSLASRENDTSLSGSSIAYYPGNIKE